MFVLLEVTNAEPLTNKTSHRACKTFFLSFNINYYQNKKIVLKQR